MKKYYAIVICLFFFSNASAQNINFPDIYFKNALLGIPGGNYCAYNEAGNQVVTDTNGDGEISIQEAAAVYRIGLSFGMFITDLTGLEHFTNLKELSCFASNFTTLDLTGLVNLEVLQCNHNNLTTLDLTSCPNLKTVYCNNNQLTSLNATGLNQIEWLDCSINQLTSLDLIGPPAGMYLNAASNALTHLGVTGNFSFSCENNQLAALDLSGCTFSDVNFNSNPLTNINMKNGQDNGFNYNFAIWSPDLQYICADEGPEMEYYEMMKEFYAYTWELNSYCTSNPGGTFYQIAGSTKFDADSNGCDGSDLKIPMSKYLITDGTYSWQITSNMNGDYMFAIPAGSYTVTPVFEQPNYFTTNPASALVTFPNVASPFEQSFCATPNGSHNDLEVNFFSVLPARPGFDVPYKLIYKNNGTTIQSGSIALTYSDNVLALVSANPTAAGQTVNTINWNFSNLLPLETRVIDLILNINAPTDTPAVNDGDILTFGAAISSATADETPADNSAILNQTVVNSFDPNDKSCLEGMEVTTEKIGEYVHYLVRFENTGTANAENIIVKDMIDLDKFDIATLIPLTGSHPFETRIIAGNRAEFFFENIQLPFDDANNDGYVAFKIKTKPTLVVGDTFANSASIYFDYNFPIVTNTATTTITALGNPDFEFSDYFTLYPNPANSELNIKANNSVEVRSINIYNILGQLVIAIPNAQQVSTIDVSNLKSGNYFIKINSDKGMSASKFIKE